MVGVALLEEVAAQLIKQFLLNLVALLMVDYE
jgi:hypothetical protein